jgi:Gene product 88
MGRPALPSQPESETTMLKLTDRPAPVNGHAARLHFGRGNAKLGSAIFTFSLPAGHSCPYAKECHSRADRDTGHITDSPNVIYRCYAASMEARRPSVRDSRWRNYELLKRARTKEAMTRLILASLSPFAGVVRVHDSGDFFSAAYMDAWLAVARERPRTLFYAYTKALPFWARRLHDVGDGHESGEVANFVMTASCGGDKG